MESVDHRNARYAKFFINIGFYLKLFIRKGEEMLPQPITLQSDLIFVLSLLQNQINSRGQPDLETNLLGDLPNLDEFPQKNQFPPENEDFGGSQSQIESFSVVPDGWPEFAASLKHVFQYSEILSTFFIRKIFTHSPFRSA